MKALKMIEGWTRGWRLTSVQVAAALVMLQLLQEQVLPLVGFAIPPAWMPYVNAGLGLAIIGARFVAQPGALKPAGQTGYDIAVQTLAEYRKWLGSEFPEVDRVLENLEAELRGDALNAGTPGLNENCTLQALREQLRRRAQARSVIEPVLVCDGSMTARAIGSPPLSGHEGQSLAVEAQSRAQALQAEAQGRIYDPDALTINEITVIPTLRAAARQGDEPGTVSQSAGADVASPPCSWPYLREAAARPWSCDAPPAPTADTASSSSTDSGGSSGSAGGSE